MPKPYHTPKSERDEIEGALTEAEETAEVKPRLFYKTTVKFVVLSEEPIPPQISLAGLHTECYDGHYVGSFGATEEVLVNGSVMVDELREAGSEPGFFELDDEGNDLPERDFDFEKDD